MIDPTFSTTNKLFVLLFENEDDRASFSKYYRPTTEIKEFFDVPTKNKEETYEKNYEIGKNNDYTTDNLLGYEYFSNKYKLIAIDLSKQVEIKEQQYFLSLRKTVETAFNFLQNAVSIIYNGNTKDHKFVKSFNQ